jgi:hypothetical protein
MIDVHRSYVPFLLLGVVSADLRPDIMIDEHLACGGGRGCGFDPAQGQFSLSRPKGLRQASFGPFGANTLSKSCWKV